MYKCMNCGRIFEKPDYEQICMEDLYGVGGMFPNRTYKTIAYCGHCGSSEIDYYYEEDEDDPEE